jgi:cell division protein FtsB
VTTRGGAAGRGPGAKRPADARTQRTRAGSPTRRPPAETQPGSGRQTTITARAAVLVLALASVMVAVALPFKIWLGQRGDITSLLAQTHQTQLQLNRLNAQDKRWQSPAYIESQARRRLHYTLPGKTTTVILGKSSRSTHAAASRHAAVSSVPWYSQFWASMETAGKSTATK